MKFEPKDPPRKYSFAGIEMSECGLMRLEADELITFVSDAGSEYDVVRKSWGYYATPSLNHRCRQFNIRGVLVKGIDTNKHFVMLVEAGREDAFFDYLKDQGMKVLHWLDTDEALDDLDRKLE